MQTVSEQESISVGKIKEYKFCKIHKCGFQLNSLIFTYFNGGKVYHFSSITKGTSFGKK